MNISCEWCNSTDVRHENGSVYWELPDGTRAIEIKETPQVFCQECGMTYQEESIIKKIEDQLFLVDTKRIEKMISYNQLMELPRLLKRNYFDFSN